MLVLQWFIHDYFILYVKEIVDLCNTWFSRFYTYCGSTVTAVRFVSIAVKSVDTDTRPWTEGHNLNGHTVDTDMTPWTEGHNLNGHTVDTDTRLWTEGHSVK